MPHIFTYLVSFTLPESMTKTTSGIVIPVSAMLVAKTILVMPRGGMVNAFFWSCDVSTECRLRTQYLKGECEYKSVLASEEHWNMQHKNIMDITWKWKKETRKQSNNKIYIYTNQIQRRNSYVHSKYEDNLTVQWRTVILRPWWVTVETRIQNVLWKHRNVGTEEIMYFQCGATWWINTEHNVLVDIFGTTTAGTKRLLWRAPRGQSWSVRATGSRRT